MSIKDALKFEKSWVGDIWKGVKRDPKRLILGVDPISTKGWNAVLGRKDKSVVGDFGGPTKESYQNAQDKGINTGTASTLHGIAKAVAAAWGGYGAANGIINGAAALGSTGAVGSGTGAAAGAGAGGGAIGSGAGVAGGAVEAMPEVVITGSSGGGLGTGAAAGAGAGAGATASQGNGNNSWRDQMQQMPGQQQDSSDDYAAEQRRLMEQMIEQERLRRESFRRNQIARAMV